MGGDIRYNVIVRPFAKGMSLQGGLADNLAGDRFDEAEASVGIDELLMIRLAQRMRSAPQKVEDEARESPTVVPLPQGPPASFRQT